MRTVTHREMRNQSGAILRYVADGETIQVTNNGQVAALIVPPGTDPLAELVSRPGADGAKLHLLLAVNRSTQRYGRQSDDSGRRPRPLVTISYLDTSAAMKLVLDEPQSEALTAELAGWDDRRLVSSWLLHTEMHCAAGRHPQDVNLGTVGAVLDSVSLIDLTRGDLLAAGTHAPLRSNDAIHLAIALRVGADEIVLTTGSLLNERQQRATVLSPGGS